MIRGMAAAALLLVSSARGDEPLLHRLFFAGSLGVTDASFTHPMLSGQAVTPSFSLQGGLALTPQLVVSLAYDGLSRHVVRSSEKDGFSLFASAADCTTCAAPAAGAAPLDVNASFTSLSGRFDVSPFGKTGPYVEGLYVGRPPELGVSAGARLGFRVRFTRTLEVLPELGLQGQWYAHARIVLPSAQVLLRLYL